MISLGNGYGDSFIFRTNSITTIENTTDELSQLSGTALGSKIFKANSLKPGDIIHLGTRVLLSTGISQPSTQRIKFGSSLIIENTGTLPNSLADNYAEMDLMLKVLTVGATGTMCAMGRTIMQVSTGISSAVTRALMTIVPVTIDTTVNNELELTYQWTNAMPNNILKVRTATLTLYN